jgi:hypothetical protein
VPDVKGLQQVPAGPAIVDNRLRRVDGDFDRVVLIESLERAGDFFERLRLCLQRRDEGALLKLGLLLETDLPPALARLGAADVLATGQPADDRAELAQAFLFGRHRRVP